MESCTFPKLQEWDLIIKCSLISNPEHQTVYLKYMLQIIYYKKGQFSAEKALILS